MARRLLNSMIFMLAAVLLMGCSDGRDGTKGLEGNNTGNTGAHTPVTITLGVWPEDSKESEKRAYEEYRDICKKKYPYITIVPAPYYYSPETFILKAESGELPTVYNTWFTEPQKIIESDYAADITELMKKNGYDRDMNPEILRLLSKNGSIYGIPRDAYALGLFINMNLYRQAGLLEGEGLPRYPGTFDALVEAAKTIKQKTGKAGMFIPTKDHVGGWHFTQLAWAFGAEFEKKAGSRWMANFNTPEAEAALQYIKDLRWKHDVLLPNTQLSWGDWIKNYGTDQVGMVFAAPDMLEAPTNEYKMKKEDIAIAPIPAGPKGQYSLMGGTAYMFSPHSTPEQLDAAFKFLDIAGVTSNITKEALEGLEIRLRSRHENGVAVGPKPLQVWNNRERISAEDAIYEKYANVNMALFRPYYENTFLSLRPEEPYYTQNLYAILDRVVQEVIMNRDAEPKAVLEKANDEFQTKFMNQNK